MPRWQNVAGVADPGSENPGEIQPNPGLSEAGYNEPGEAVHSELTEAGKVMGTPSYMAPEQTSHPAEVDHRADIYALGVVFYQMLTGELPAEKIAPPSRKVVLDVRLDEVVLRALEKEPSRRYQQASAMKTQVETIAGSGRLGVPPAGVGVPPNPSAGPPLKSARGWHTTPENLATLRGAFTQRQGTGELALYPDRLVLSAGWQRTEIPLASLHAVRMARVPLWRNPIGHGMLSLTYEESGQTRCLLFIPGEARLRAAGETRAAAAEWIVAIRSAIKAAGGSNLPDGNGDPVVVPASPWIMVLVAGVPLLPVLFTLWLPIGLQRIFGAFELFLLTIPLGMVVFVALGLWLSRRPSGGPPPGHILAPAPPHPEEGKEIAGSVPRSGFGRKALVVSCNGQRLTNWPGVIQTGAVLYLGILVGLWVTFSRWVPLHDLMAITSGMAIMVTTALVRVALRQPVAGLPPLDARTAVPAASPNRGWKWFGIMVLTLGGILAGYVVVALVIPSLIREHKALLVQHQQEAAAKDFGPVVPFVRPDHAGFGPTIELTVPLHDHGYSDTLDPDSGMIVPTPEMATPWDWATTLLPKGIMIVSPTLGNPPILAGTSTRVWSLPGGTDYWDGRMALIDATAGSNLGVDLGQTVLAASSIGMAQVFCFQTPSGKRGLLQITGFTGQLHQVELRYKLVQQAVTAKAAEAPPPAPTFGPVIERTVADLEAIAFDAGKLATVPESVQGDEITVLAWMERQAMDAVWVEDDEGDDDNGLWGAGMKAERLDRAAWDNLTSEQLRQTLVDVSGQALQQMSHGTESPIWAFQTRTGGLGLLQALGFTEKGAVKIRYKLVQGAPASLVTSAQAEPVVLRLKLAEAESGLKQVEARVAAGLNDPGEMDAAQDAVELIKAQLTGEPQQVAQARLAAAERKLKLITSRANAGLLPGSEIDSAKAGVEVRRAQLSAIMAAAPPSKP